MLYLKLKQLQFERDMWKRLLGFMMDENINMKNRIATVLKEPFDNNLLEDFESFQNRFIRLDDLIGLLRNDLVQLEQLLIIEIFENNNIAVKVDYKIKNLRHNIIITEK